MITFSHLGRYGRLGNQLFQYAALKSLALKKGYEVKIPDFSQSQWHGQQCLLKNFNIDCEVLNPDDSEKITFSYNEPNVNQFDRNFFDIDDGADLLGFFQFTDYFKEFEKNIRKEFTPKDFFLEKANEVLSPLREGSHEVVSIHIRRGDMMTHMYGDTGVSPYEVFGKYDILDEDTIFGKYLNNAMKFFEGKKVKYLIFTGGKRDGNDTSDIEYVKEVCEYDNFYFSETNDPMIDFATIMSCDHNITCHQSTFGWWAAFLNPNEDKIVTSPENYFFLYNEEENKKRTSSGHFPEDWKII